jgi:hypothetical protein
MNDKLLGTKKSEASYKLLLMSECADEHECIEEQYNKESIK